MHRTDREMTGKVFQILHLVRWPVRDEWIAQSVGVVGRVDDDDDDATFLSRTDAGMMKSLRNSTRAKNG
jgi:hypothetical protein